MTLDRRTVLKGLAAGFLAAGVQADTGKSVEASKSDNHFHYHEDRTHLGLRKETPGRRIRSAPTGPVICHARLGGLHHRYDRAA